MKYVFSIIPASSGPIWLLVFIGVFMVGMVILFGYLAYSSRHVTFELGPEGLRIRGDMYGRSIPASALIVDEVRPIDLGLEKGFQLKWRTNGAGLPGYKSGWFKLRNGQKALAFITDKRRVVYVPTQDGYSVLLSVREPDEFVRACKELFGGS
ncbi:MAG: hypothetical protein GTO51_00890 [Candidatus Latescibacteria bacterium]|nr:hypothetical protein [Candidatus Latescibacterota bacterium]NIM64537.1 hypothetical protein [Candidatus Latescibacterota bacterium]NIO00690.1 hypothetical protein [Candidatus Latescibacterota bacterium]NIO27093.1 hypothetical protein [Candidatus Latescibacterota bacterium]NIO54617.1 hypothetical protein [Candidatus Latescibacterota bacterium]